MNDVVVAAAGGWRRRGAVERGASAQRASTSQRGFCAAVASVARATDAAADAARDDVPDASASACAALLVGRLGSALHESALSWRCARCVHAYVRVGGALTASALSTALGVALRAAVDEDGAVEGAEGEEGGGAPLPVVSVVGVDALDVERVGRGAVVAAAHVFAAEWTAPCWQ